MTLWDETPLTWFNGRPENWGAVIQTIQSGSSYLRCMATFGHWIAVAWSDDLVRIYDVVTGAMKLSLGPMGHVEVVKGSPDGTILFCLHRQKGITLWDTQTGRLIHSFTLEWTAQDIAVSSKGHYLCCLFSCMSAKVWEVGRGAVSKVDAAAWNHSSVAHLCWLGPEEQLMTINHNSVDIWDVVAGTILRTFKTPYNVSSAVYSQELNRLATMSILKGTVVIIDPQTGVSSMLPRLSATPHCFAFSPATEELVCGMLGGGLEVFSFSTRRWRNVDYTPTTFISSVPNGTVVVCSMDYNVQVLSLDDRHAPSSPVALGLTVSTLDQGRIIVTVQFSPLQVRLLEISTLAIFHTITHPDFTFSCPPTLSASLENRMVVYFLNNGSDTLLELCKFDDALPKWTKRMHPVPSNIAISPSGNWLMVFYGTESLPRICIWDVWKGVLHAQLTINASDSLPSDITFDSETRFYLHYDNHCIPHDLNLSLSAPTLWVITRHEQQPWAVESSKGGYKVDTSGKASGAKRL